MTADSHAKRVVLRGVYEDNLGLPRTFTGKRRTGNGERALGKTLGGAEKIALTSLCVLALLVGISFRTVGGGSVETDAQQVIGDQEAHPRNAATAPSAGNTGERLMVAGADGAAKQAVYSASATTEQYATMLSRLNMPVADLFDLKVQTIVIDPGHGGSDPGAIGHHGLEEKDVALDIARRLHDKLVAAGSYRVLLTREDDRKLRLKERVAFAKRSHADLFISVHINSVPEEAGPVNYAETYYFGPQTDQRTLDLAEKENRDSDYAIGDFRKIIAEIGDTLKSEESAQLATAIQHRLYGNLKRDSSNLLDAGVKSGPFVVLLGVEVPSVLVEVSCISNEEEAARLRRPQYRDNIASYLETAVVEYLERRNPHEAKRSQQTNVGKQREDDLRGD
jgi:N-acetylmuramoyl-L-alanine amidase